MVGSAIEETERPAWLLKQVRDLTENWEIPLGEELEKYLDQVNNIFYTSNFSSKVGFQGRMILVLLNEEDFI